VRFDTRVILQCDFFENDESVEFAENQREGAELCQMSVIAEINV
jgi:hypothetical protein